MMSCIVALPIVIPAAQVALPIVVSAIASAAGVLGYTAVKGRGGTKVSAGIEVEVDAASVDNFAGHVAAGQTMVFQRDDVTLTVVRDERGRLTVKAHSNSRSEEQLRQLAGDFCNRVAQQYAYHTLMGQLQERGFNVVDQQVEEDGTVRVKVRTYQG